MTLALGEAVEHMGLPEILLLAFRTGKRFGMFRRGDWVRRERLESAALGGLWGGSGKG